MANEKVNVTKEWLLSFYNAKIKPYLNGASGAIDDSSTASNKTWSAQKINNSLDKHTYSTTEKAVGTWIDGKTIYEKTIDFGALPNNTAKSVNHNISSLNMIIKISGIAWNPSSKTALNIPDNPETLPVQTYNSTQMMETYNIRITVDNSTVRISDRIDRSSFNGYVTIQYTKA